MFGLSLETGGLIAGIISIIVGILIFVWPRLLAYIAGAYFIIIGIIAVLYAVV